MPPGSYAITAQATDSVGNTATSTAVNVTVGKGMAKVYYLYSDQTDTPRVITDSSSNAIVWRWDDADPFGMSRPDSNPSGLGTFTYNLRFPGQVYDQETNLSYNWHRYYDSQTGRYTQVDPLGLFGGSMSPYSYVGGNPLSRIDPLGLSDVVFNRGAGTITIYNSGGEVVGTYPAANNTTSTSGGPWPDGTYNFSHYMSHPESAADGPYGSNGNFVFDVPGRTGMGIHAGRSGPQSKTLGCIRTTNEATEFLRQLHQHDPIQTITVESCSKCSSQ